jgi:DNA mismatch repair protein MutS
MVHDTWRSARQVEAFLMNGGLMGRTTFHSILYERSQEGREKEPLEAPDFFVDLNLDQVVEAITIGKQEYNLKPFFYASLHDASEIEYRQEIMRDLENRTLFENIGSFAQKMQTMRKRLAQADKLYYKYQKERWFLEAVGIYCNAANGLVADLSAADLKSRGLRAFREYLTGYVHSDRFAALQAETEKLVADLATVKYIMRIRGNSIQVRKYDSEIDYSAEVEDTFAKFKQGAVKDYRREFPDWPDMNHVEAKVLEFVAHLHSEVFLDLDEYCSRNSNYLDTTIGDFDRAIQFYIAYLGYVALFKQAGLEFCYPRMAATAKEVHDSEGFDVALAYRLVTEHSPVVCNDFYVQGQERIAIVSGPNQGGKTTFARTFGQLHYLASLGCPVPGREAQLFLFDRLFTHFEKEEKIEDLRGKLEDDLFRIHQVLEQATPNSIVILNEVFTSTTLDDAVFLSNQVMEKLDQLDLLCVWVTFVEELASFSEKTVSMVSTVVPDNPAQRTFKIVRMPADGLAYALSIVEKYHLTYDYLKERITA